MKKIYDDHNFKKICNCISNDINTDLPVFSSNLCNAWPELMNFCEYYYKFGPNYEYDGILYPAIHKIAWGVYPDTVTTANEKEIIDTLVKEMLTNPESRRTWMKTESFKEKYNLFTISWESDTQNGPGCNSQAHADYVYSHCKKKISNDVSLSVTSENYFIDYATEYEAVIKKILPEANTWSEYDWVDDKKILEGLSSYYDIKYPCIDPFDDSDEYEALIWLLLTTLIEKDNFNPEIFADIKIFSMKLAMELWGHKALDMLIIYFEELIKMFIKQEITFEKLESCWLYRNIIAMYFEKRLPDKSRKSICNIMCKFITNVA